MQPRPVSNNALFPNMGQAVLLVVVAAVLQFGCGATIGGFASLLGGGDQPGLKLVSNPWVLGAVNLTALSLTIALGLRGTKEPAARFYSIRRFDWSLVAPSVLTALSLAVVMHELDNYFLDLLQYVSGSNQIPEELFNLTDHPIGALLTVVVVAPVTEEYLFRGLILRGLLTRHRAAVAVAFGALLFGLMHANLRQLHLGIAIGLLFGWWYVRTGSVGPGLIGHAVFNAVAWCAAQFPDLFSPLGTGAIGMPVMHQPAWLPITAAVVTGLGIGWFKRCADGLPRPEPPLPPVPAEEPPLRANPSLLSETPPLLEEPPFWGAAPLFVEPPLPIEPPRLDRAHEEPAPQPDPPPW